MLLPQPLCHQGAKSSLRFAPRTPFQHYTHHLLLHPKMKLFLSVNLNLFCNQRLVRIQKQCALLLLLIVCSIQVHATHTWTGAVNKDWSNAGNWNPASLPNSSDFVKIPNVANDPELITGDIFTISGLEIGIGGSLKININAQLSIVGAIGNGMLNEGEIINFGSIIIGFPNAINGIGIYNKGILLNRKNGKIQIDQCNDAAIFCDHGDIDNFGKIEIGNFSNISGEGIHTLRSTVSNYENAEITIDRTSNIALRNDTESEIRNFGKILIGSKDDTGAFGINNNGRFNNYSTGQIQIDRVSMNAIKNDSAEPFNNTGQIKIGGLTNAGQVGIANSSDFNNLIGEIKIDRVGLGVNNDYFGTFKSNAKLTIGSLATLSDNGISNNGFFLNLANGLIAIDRVVGAGIFNKGKAVGSFSNAGKIVIGANSALLEHGIYNDAAFKNEIGAEITINHISSSGIYNLTPGDRPFENHGTITIGNTANIGYFGIQNQTKFLNFSSGLIFIDRFTDAGLNLDGYVADYVNEGKLIIGAFSSTGLRSIHNEGGSFGNATTGELRLENSTETGILNELGAVWNEGKMIILGNSANYSIKNLASFRNEACAQMLLEDAVYNGAQWTNVGVLRVNTSASHTNVVSIGNFFYNDGIIEYPQGNPIPNVGNHDLIAVPVSAACNTITPALNLGNSLSFTVATTWYTNSALSIPAGTYNQASNTFTATAAATILYFTVQDDVNGCDRLVSIKATYQLDLTPPTVVCKSTTAELNASGTATINPVQVFLSGTDNCGVVSPASVAPSSFQCANIGVNTVTLTVNDGNGNNASCQATVNVVDKMGPALICKPFTANLNAAGTVSITPANVFQSGTDNCGAVNLQSLSPNTFTCANLGNQLVTLTANDGHGNTGTCQATVTIVDKVVPTMLCKSATITLNAAGQASLTVAQVNNGSYDNCGIVTMGINKTTFDCSNIGANNVTLGGADQSSNKGTCVAVVTVVDPIKPIALCKNATVNLGTDGNLNLSGQAVNNGSSDNCSLSLSVTPSTFNCGNIGLNTVTLKATDNGGNTATCTAKVTIKDATAPLALCKNTTIFLNDVGQATLTVAQVNNGSSDACGISSMTLSKTVFNCSDIPGSSQTIQLTLKDLSNNIATCNAVVTIKDNIVPTAVCANTSIKLGPNGTATVYSSNLALDSYDNCSVWSYAPIAKVYTTANLGNNNLTITVKDWSANGSTCVSVVQVLPFSGLKSPGSDRDSNPTDENAAFSVYPNPGSGTGTLAFELTKKEDYSVILFDMSGKIVWTFQGTGDAGTNTLPISLTNVPPAVYFLDFQSENLKKQTRWVIQK